MENKNNVLIVALITSFIATFMGSALNLAIPTIEKDLDVSAARVGLIVTSYMLTCAVFAVPFGRLGDRYNRKMILCLGLMVFGSASVTSIYAKNFEFLIMARAFQGVGTSMIFSSNIAILIENSNGSQRGRNLGFAAAANYAGLSAGPFLGGMLNYYFGWKGIFFTAAVVSWSAFIIAIAKVPKSQSSDSRSSLKSLVRNRRFIFSNIAAFVNYGGTFAASYMLSIFLQEDKGFSSRTAGFVLVAAPLVQTAVSLVVGKFSDKVSPHKLSAFGMAICAISLGLCVMLEGTTPMYIIIIAIALCGLGSGVFSSPNTNAVMTAAKKENYGLASSVLSAMRSLGHTFSTSLIMLVGNNQICFILFSMGCIAGIFMALVRKP